MRALADTLKGVRSVCLNSCHPSLHLHESKLTSQGRETLVLATDVPESMSNAKNEERRTAGPDLVSTNNGPSSSWSFLFRNPEQRLHLYWPSLTRRCWIMVYYVQVVPKWHMALLCHSRAYIPAALAESKLERFM